MKRIAVCSVFYNTKFLLDSLYFSFIRNSNIDADFYLFDNSRDKSKRIEEKQTLDKKVNVRYLPSKMFEGIFGSEMHCKTIQIALNELLTKYDFLILLDSDIVITGDLSHIIDKMANSDFDIAGWHDGKVGNKRNLIHPSFLFIKTKNIVKNNIVFFDKNRILKKGKDTYDTGMSFYEDVLKCGLKVLELPFNENYNHFGCGSRALIPGKTSKNSMSTHTNINKWLKDMEKYYKQNL